MKGGIRGAAKPIIANNTSLVDRTLMSRWDYGIMIIDEAHEYRSGGACFDALIHLRDRTLCVLAMTATPLYNSGKVNGVSLFTATWCTCWGIIVQDLRNIARLINIPRFKTANEDQDEARSNTMQTKLHKLEMVLRGQPPDANTAEIVQEIKTLRRLIYEDILSIRHGFGDLIIRRTLKSPGEDGVGTVGTLRPYKEIVAFLTLSEEESKDLEKLNELVAEVEGQEPQKSSVSPLLPYN
jgi:hypothetical protein